MLYRIKIGFDHQTNSQLHQVESKPDGAPRFGLLYVDDKPAVYRDEAVAKAHLHALRLTASLDDDHAAVDVRHGAAWADFYRLRDGVPQEQPATDEAA